MNDSIRLEELKELHVCAPETCYLEVPSLAFQIIAVFTLSSKIFRNCCKMECLSVHTDVADVQDYAELESAVNMTEVNVFWGPGHSIEDIIT